MADARDPGEAAGGQPPDEPGVAAQLRALRAEVDLLDQVVQDFLHPTERPGGAGDPPAGGGAGERFEPFYGSLPEWVGDYFAPVYARPVTPAVRWCAQWWDHAEVISRLEALWRSWEAQRLDPLRGMALWYRDFLDSQLAVLTSPGGPFAQCTPDRHSPVKPLPTAPAPDGWWADAAEPAGEPLPEGSRWRPGGTTRGDRPGTDSTGGDG